MFVPGICVVAAVLSLNFLGDSVRDAADPRLNIADEPNLRA